MDSPPQRLGKFEILRKIGHGGMGSVSLARDTLLGREVALKTILPNQGHPEDLIRRFRQEAMAVARLQHPNLVTIHEFGEIDGVCFLAMEFVNGYDLEELITHSVLDRDQVGAVLVLILGGLQEAHQKNVIHRDVKPSNIRIFSARGMLSAKLLDFGLAKISSEGSITHSTALAGTPYYMAPELLKGGHPDVQTDLWSVAVIFLRFLLGRRPFEASTPAGIYYKIVFEPSEAILQELPAEHQRFRAFIARALNKDAAERFSSAQEMMEAMRVVLLLPRESLPAPAWLENPGADGSDDLPTAWVSLGGGLHAPMPPIGRRSSGFETSSPGAGSHEKTSSGAIFPELDPLHQQASAGDPDAQNALGLRYLVGDGAFQDLSKAESLFRKAADQGFASAMVNLASLLLRRKGVPIHQEAQDWLRKASVAGNAEAQSRLGAMLLESLAPTSREEGLDLLKASARKGFPEAAAQLVCMAYRGEVHPDQEPEFDVWLEQAASCSSPEAMVMQARRHYRDGEVEKALEILERAWEQGFSDSAYELGQIHLGNESLEAARDWMLKATWKNHPGAGLALAKLFLQEGGPEAEASAMQALRDPAAAGDPEAMYLRSMLISRLPPSANLGMDGQELLRRSVQCGYPPALLALARELREHPQQREESFQLLQKAAEGGLPEAEFELGTLMLKAGSGAGNPKYARELILRAAQAGVPGAMHAQWESLTRAGVNPKDPAALNWLRRAAEAHHHPSLFQLGVLLSEGDPAEQKEAVTLLCRLAREGNNAALPPLRSMLHHGHCKKEDLEGLDLDPPKALKGLLGKVLSKWPFERS